MRWPRGSSAPSAPRRKFKRERDARRGIELSTYRDELLKEFEYADPDLITGKSKQEMRSTAERAHNVVLKVIEKKGLKAVQTTETPAEKEARLEAETTAKRKGEWGAAPPVATEAVSGEAPMDYAELRQAALTGRDAQGRPMDRAAVLADIKNNGAARITRPTIASAALRGRGEPVAK
jgi:hypothetical protein